MYISIYIYTYDSPHVFNCAKLQQPCPNVLHLCLIVFPLLFLVCASCSLGQFVLVKSSKRPIQIVSSGF